MGRARSPPGPARAASSQGCPTRASCGSASTTPHLARQARTRSLRELVPRRASSSSPRAGWSRSCARSRTPGRSSKIRAAAQLADEALARGARARPRRAHRARRRARPRVRDAPPRRARRVASRRSSPPARTARCRTPCRATSRSRAGTLVVIDWGAQLDGYASDCTRTFATGELDPRDREVYDLVAARAGGGARRRAARARPAARSTRSRARSSTPPATPSTSATGSATASGSRSTRARGCRKQGDDALARRPWSSPSSPASTCPGAVGVRIEDLVVVTEDGHEVLSSLPKELQTVA